MALANQGMMPLAQWWEGAQRRITSPQVEFRCGVELGDGGPDVPAEVFDGALENLTHNALRKQGAEGEIQVQVELAEGPALTVRDNGSEIPEEIHKRMFSAPLPSSAGMGIGLY
ncbi:MAG: sensor histidine kinase, partial [Betaproteobacteria bacterium AqS2]|nr:sensor histidine kinase [Betaproteobacteria bacterium AqS2]